MGWRVRNQGLELSAEDREMLDGYAYFQAGRNHQGGTQREAETLAWLAGRLMPEELE
jgi:hypothetical protein